MPRKNSLDAAPEPATAAVEQNPKQKQDLGLPADDTLDRRTLFVRAVPTEATSEELSEFFSQFVPVKHAVVVTDGEKQLRGFGFVSFTEDEDTLTALVEAKKNKFKGRFLRVDIAKRRDRKKDGAATEKVPRAPREPVEKRKARLIVRNLPWLCKEALKLTKIFSKFGAVHDAYIPTKTGGQMKGFAFVVMKKQAAADRAVKESAGLKIDGREVAVDLAVEKSKWEAQKEEEKDEEKEEDSEKDEEDEEKDEEKDEENEDESGSDLEGSDEDFDELNEVKSDEEEEHKPRNKQEAFSVFVRNIPYDADQESLEEHFAKFGPVKYALPVMDRATGLAKGSAFVAFRSQDAYDKCLANAPTASATSMLISDDVAPEYVYQGRILSIASTVDRSLAGRLADRNSEIRLEALGKDLGDRDRRNLYLLNEGRITENSRLAQFVLKTDMEMREKLYKLRVQQLNKNPQLHLSLTRLAIRNLPRALNEKALKALGRKAVVEFATEVKNGARQPLSKEEMSRLIKSKQEGKDEVEKKSNKKKGVVRQAKVIMEVKGTGETGRSRGYGFIEFRDHKAALMGLRWLNAHEVTIQEITEGMSDEQKKVASLEGLNKRQLIAEFAIENAQVVRRRQDRVMAARLKRGREDDGEEAADKRDSRNPKKRKGPSRKGNMNKGAKAEKPPQDSKAESDTVKHIIARKRKGRKAKN